MMGDVHHEGPQGTFSDFLSDKAKVGTNFHNQLVTE